MTHAILASTRKGLFTLAPNGSRWDIERVDFLAEPVSIALHDPRDQTTYAALNLGHFGVKIHRRRDGEWKEVGVPAFTADAKLMQIWALEPAGPTPGTLWAGTIPGGLFHSADAGDSWQLNEPLWNMPERQQWFGGGADQPGIHSVCVHPTIPGNVTLAVSCGGVWHTDDSGDTWHVRGEGMVAEYMPPERKSDPIIQDPHRMVACPADPDVMWIQHHNGVFRSTDRARNWHTIANVAPSVFGFAVVVHPKQPDTAWFVPAVKDERRIPVDGKVVVARTRDGGKSFDVLRDGLPQHHAYDLVYRHAMDISTDGSLLAFGSTTGSLWVSEDQGDHWITCSEHLPPIYAVQCISR